MSKKSERDSVSRCHCHYTLLKIPTDWQSFESGLRFFDDDRKFLRERNRTLPIIKHNNEK